mgnify:CR=1 FL=1
MMDFLRLSKIRRPSSTPLTMEAKLSVGAGRPPVDAQVRGWEGGWADECMGHKSQSQLPALLHRLALALRIPSPLPLFRPPGHLNPPFPLSLPA